VSGWDKAVRALPNRRGSALAGHDATMDGLVSLGGSVFVASGDVARSFPSCPASLVDNASVDCKQSVNDFATILRAASWCRQ
jgi:hypothetical protein